MIHSGNEPVAASDVTCHVIFFALKQASKQCFLGVVDQGLKHVSKLQCHTLPSLVAVQRVKVLDKVTYAAQKQ